MDVGTYEVTFWYRNSGATYPEKLEVKWGSSPNAAGMTNGPIFSDDNIASENYLEATAEIVITTQGSYFIGWHGYSDPNMYFLLVDDISVRAHYVWTGSVSDAWDNSGNWDRGAVPGPEDIVIIPASPTGGIFPVIASGSSVEVFSLRCDASNISIQGDLIVKGKKIL
jgi:hypothetical protein